jgi:hypothetical protein
MAFDYDVIVTQPLEVYQVREQDGAIRILAR